MAMRTDLLFKGCAIIVDTNDLETATLYQETQAEKWGWSRKDLLPPAPCFVENSPRMVVEPASEATPPRAPLHVAQFQFICGRF